MPYIKKEAREQIEYLVGLMNSTRIPTGGDLNYLITQLTHAFLNQRTKSYQNFSDAGFALEGAAQELYRKYVAPYEDLKAEENGDVP